MAFHDVLRMAVRSKGDRIMADPELIPMIDAMDGFVGRRALRFVLRAAIESGVLRRFVACGEWDVTSRQIVDRFVAHTGFQPVLAGYMFQSMAFALGWIDRVAEDRPEYQVLSSGFSQAVSSEVDGATDDFPEINQQWNCRWSEDEKKAHLTGLIEINHEREPQLGIHAEKPLCVAVANYGFRITFTMSRIEPRATGALFYAVYDPRGFVLSTAAAGVLCMTDVSNLPRTVTINVAPEKVARIILFWD